MADALSISLAGLVAVHPGGRHGTEVPLGSRARVALAYLVVERARPVTAGVLADAIWGSELPPTWRDALRGIIARVRAALTEAGLDAATVLTSGPGGYQLRLPPAATVDVEVAQSLLRSARETLARDAKRASAEAQDALEILQGEFVPGAEGAWVERRQAEFAELRLRALETLSEAASACGDSDTALAAAEEAVTLEPLRESAHVRAMLAHERAGNRGAALRAYERCRRVLAEELGVGPAPETEVVYIRLLGDEGPDGPPSDHPAPGNLPCLVTRFIGRDADQSRIGEALRTSRLVTLTGPGGVGKSRLALHVAQDVEGRYPDGVWLVELAGVPTSRTLAAQIMSDLGIPDVPGNSAEASLIAAIGTKRLLLILDNCEHLIPACAEVVDRLLSSGPGIGVLATSREPLGVGGEMVWAVAPLGLADAVELFCDRAHAAAPMVDLDPSRSTVATICRRLDGLPLAIELAAARMRSMAVDDIARRLDCRLRLLGDGPRTSPARHRTLRATLDWSYESLSEQERRLFENLSVFAGDFTPEAAQALWTDDVYVTLETLGHLVDKSLVVAHSGSECARYRLLEVMREYAHDALTARNAEAQVRRAQLEWSANLAEQAEQGLEGAEQLVWLRVIDGELDNLRDLLDWAARHSAASDGARIAASLWRYWEIRGLLNEGRARLDAARVDALAPALRAKLLNGSAVLAQRQGDARAARAHYSEALAIRRALGDLRGAAASLNGLGNVAVGEGDLFSARAIFEDNLATSREQGEPRLLAASLMNLGVVFHLLFASGHLDALDGATRSHALYAESLAVYRELDDRRAIAQCLENLGAVAPYLGDDAGAQAYLEESLALRRELDDRSGIAASARFLGHLALKGHRYGAARSLHEECLAIEQDLGNQLLVVADLASLAEIAAAEGKPAEARQLVERALQMARHLGDVEWAVNLRRRLAALRPGSVAADLAPG